MFLIICSILLFIGLTTAIAAYSFTHDDENVFCLIGGFLVMITVFIGFGLIAFLGTFSSQKIIIQDFKIEKTDAELIISWFDKSDGTTGTQSYNDVWLFNNSNKIKSLKREKKWNAYGLKTCDYVSVEKESLKKQAEIEKWTTQQQH